MTMSAAPADPEPPPRPSAGAPGPGPTPVLDLEALAQLPSDVVSILDAEGRARWISPSVERTLGYSMEDYAARAGLDLFHPDDRPEVIRRWRWMLRSPDNEIRLEARIKAADGSWRWIEAVATNHLADPAVNGIVTNFRDVSERRVAEEALTASEERFRALVSASTEVIATTDAAGVITYCSPSSDRVFGRGPDEMVGTTPLEFVHPDDHGAVAAALAPVFAEPGGVASTELRVRHADGRWRWTETVVRNLVDDPFVHGVVCTVRDIDDRKRAEEAQRRSEERFRALVQESTDVVILCDSSGVMTWVSPAVRHVLGLDPDELVGTNGTDLTHPDDLEAMAERLGPVYAEPGARQVGEARYRDVHGAYRWMELTVTNLLEDERVGGVVVHARDVTERREADRLLRASEERFRAMAQASPIGVFQQDAAQGCTYVNARWQEITGRSMDEAAGDGWKQTVHPEDAERLGLFEPSATARAGEESQYRVVRPDGEIRWVSARVGTLHDDDGAVRAFVGTLEDITDRLAAQRDSERLTDIFEATEDLVGIVDRAGALLYVNRAARRFFRLPPSGELPQLGLDRIMSADAIERAIVEVGPQLEIDGMWTGEIEVPRADGQLVPMLTQVLAHRAADGPPEYFSIVMHDISERKQFESALAHQATHDPLTGLPNRSLLLERLDASLARARRHRSRVAVLFLDLDHFKVVNDSLGHELGDELLKTIARRLHLALRPADVVARFGGDEFVVLCEDLVGADDAVAIARRITDSLGEPFVVGESEVFVGVSIGIAFPDDNEVEASTLIRDADAAMYRAKAKGRARWEVFDNAMRASAIDRLDIENALRRAVERRELRVHYQPLVSLDTGAVRGVEALLRWEHPERGMLAPGDFITVAEETGLIVPIGVWVLRAACQQLQRWTADGVGHPRFSLSVNLSGRQLSSPSLVDDVAAVLDETGIDPSRIELEITESVLMDDVDASQETLTALRRLGVRLGIDDFGTGYSSMSYLRRFPVDVLKVDRSFVDGLGADPSDSAIVAAIVTLAHTLGLRAVAEGVETGDHLAELRRLGCDYAQGFLFARPMPGDALATFLGDDPTW